MSLVINFSIDKWMESMSSITSSQKIIKIIILPMLKSFQSRSMLLLITSISVTVINYITIMVIQEMHMVEIQ